MIKAIIIVFLLGLQVAVAQQKTLIVSGDVTDTVGVGVENCTITISGAKDGLIYSHFNVGAANTFSSKIIPGPNDSLVVEVEHLSFELYSKTYAIPAGASAMKLSVTLHSAIRKLGQINIPPPRMWKRGDTTFYKVNQFKEGDEKKLKDLLLKLPGFQLEDNGQVSYHHKPVDKVLMDGEELFADKIELMLNNFPVHVINTVQVIENQSSQKLLRGLSGENKTFINLQLNKKNSLSAGFGEADAGIGNQGRYDFSPVLFSMYSTVKLGFIGNYNSIGNGIGFQQQNELRNSAEQEAQPLLMANDPLYLINNFEQRWYIQNRQWDSRFQINAPLSKTTRSQTEISYVADRQPQQIYNTSLLLDNGRYEPRTDSTSNLNKPSVLSLKQTFTIQPDSIRTMKVVLSLYDDKSAGQQSIIYSGFGIAAPLANATRNQWSSLTLSSDYTVRYAPRKAGTFSLFINRQNLEQSATGTSSDIAGIFALPDGYNQMNNRLNTNFFEVQGNWKLLVRDKKNYLINFGVTVDHKHIGLNQALSVDNTAGNLTVVNQSMLSNLTGYDVTQLNASFLRSFKAVLKDPFTFTADVGATHYSPGYRDSISAFSTFIFKGTLGQKHHFSDGLAGELNLGIYQWQLQPEELFSQYYPSSIVSYNRYFNLETPLRRIEGSYALSFSPSPDDLTVFGLSFTGALMPNGPVTYSTYDSFIGFTDTYLLNRSTSRKNILFSATVPSLLLNAMLDFDISYGTNSFLISSGNQIFKTSLDIFSLYFSLKKNWNRKYFIKINSGFTTDISTLPASSGDSQTKVAFLKNTINQRLLLSKQMNLVSNFDLYNNNLFTPNRANFVIADIEWNYQWKQAPFYLSVKTENLFNEKNYYNYNNSVLEKSFTTIPLVGRSIYISARYTF